MDTFARGVKLFRDGQYQEAVDCFSEALARGGDKFKILDSRAAAYQKLDKPKDALRDAKAVIDLHPDRWQGYARSARVFHQARKYDAAARMVELALERIAPDMNRRRDDMVALQGEIAATQAMLAKAISKRTYHFGKLPVEIATAMFTMVLEDDHAYVVTLAQVCRNWRATILNTPSFWSTLVLGSNRPKRKVKLWRERSRDRIRELALLETFADFIPVCEELRSLSFDALRAIRLHVQDPKWLLRDFAVLTHQTFASLHRVVLHAAEPEIYHAPSSPTDVTTYDWRVLEFAKIIITEYHDLARRLSRLEILSLSECPSYGNWDDCLWLLSYNPNLVQLEISKFMHHYITLPNEGESREGPPAVITMPSLASIRLDDADQLANRLLPRLIAPSLESLHISLHRQRLDACLSWLAAGPASRLTTLSIQRSPVVARLLLDILPTAVALESLQLTHVCDVAQPVLKALATPLEVAASDNGSADTGADQTPKEGNVRRVCCPSLRHLDVSHCPDVAARPIIGLVKLRLPEAQPPASPAGGSSEGTKGAWPPARRLESLVIDGCPDVDADALPWLRAAVPSVSCVYLTRKTAKWRR